MPVGKRAFPSGLINRMNENIARGKAAREIIGQKLAEMSPHEIAKLPRSALTRIGPLGIATMAHENAIAGLRVAVGGRLFKTRAPHVVLPPIFELESNISGRLGIGT